MINSKYLGTKMSVGHTHTHREKVTTKREKMKKQHSSKQIWRGTQDWRRDREEASSSFPSVCSLTAFTVLWVNRNCWAPRGRQTKEKPEYRLKVLEELEIQ